MDEFGVVHDAFRSPRGQVFFVMVFPALGIMFGAVISQLTV